MYKKHTLPIQSNFLMEFWQAFYTLYALYSFCVQLFVYYLVFFFIKYIMTEGLNLSLIYGILCHFVTCRRAISGVWIYLINNSTKIYNFEVGSRKRCQIQLHAKFRYILSYCMYIYTTKYSYIKTILSNIHNGCVYIYVLLYSEILNS